MGENKGVLVISKCLAGTFAFVIIALFIGEGLLIGLLNQPECDTAVPVNPPDNNPTTEKTTTTKPTSDTPESGLWTNPRLPLSLIPESYEIDLRPSFTKFNNTYWFYGSSKVVFVCDVATDYVLLNTRDLEYDEPWELTQADTGKTVPIKSWMFYKPNSYLVLELESKCDQGTKYQFSAPSFYGELGTDLDGLYRSEYVNELGETRVIATSQMETTGARMAFPSFDEPAFKAIYKVTLRHTEEYTAVANMPVESEEEETDSDGTKWIITHFKETPIMSTYLLAMTVTDFSSLMSATTKNVTTGIYARTTLIDNGDMDYTSIISPLVIDVFDDHLNVFYPLVKSDQMCVPDFGAGAMENWGLVIYREYYLIYDDVISSPGNKYSVTSVISHELAHQWFGNLVTCSYWNEIWLNEGFATYFSYVGVEGVQPDYKSWEMFIIDDFQVALSADDSSSSHPLVHPEGYFSSISYSKGGSILRMTEEFLGQDTFTTALTNYLDEFQYSIVSHDDLFAAWIDQAKTDGLSFPYDLQNVFESWSLQMGYPLITVRRTGDQIYMTQEYFLIDPEDSPKDTEYSDRYKYRWYVPITYKTSSNIASSDHEREWMNLDDTLEIPITSADDYVLVNVDAKGFFRVKYEGDLWTQIKSAIKDDLTKFSPENRAMFLDDAFAISKSQRLDVEEVLDLSLYLKDEHDYIAWSTFDASISYYEQMLSSSSIYGEFSNYILDMVVPAMYEHYGWDDTNTDDSVLVERLSRGLGVDMACFYKHPDCVETAKAEFAEWVADSNNLVASAYRSDVYCTAIRAGGVAEWDYMWEQYLISNSAQHQTSLRYGLSCSQDSWVINRYLDRVLDTNNVRLQDSSSTLSYIGRHESSKYVAWAYAANNWNQMISAVGSSAVSSLLSAAVGRFSTSYDLKLVDDLMEIAGPVWTGTLNSYKARIETNMKWREINEERIANWLGAASYKPDPKMFKIESPTPRHLIPPIKDSAFEKARADDKMKKYQM